MGRTGEASEQKMEHKNKKNKKKQNKKKRFCSLGPEDDFKLKEQVQKGLEYQNMSMWALVILAIILHNRKTDPNELRLPLLPQMNTIIFL